MERLVGLGRFAGTARAVSPIEGAGNGYGVQVPTGTLLQHK